jgi:hypothetical protein
VAVYRLVTKLSATKELDAVEPKKLRQRLVRAIEELAAEPRPAGREELAVVPTCIGSGRATIALSTRSRIGIA